MSVPIRDFLKARRDRALGTILGWSEQNLYSDLSPEQREAFRAKVYEAMNSYHDTILDLWKSDGGDARNAEVLQLLQELHTRVVNGQVRARVEKPVHSTAL